MATEEWRDVVGYPEIAGIDQVSNLGRVRTLDRKCPLVNGPGRGNQTHQFRKGRVLSPYVAQNGYLTVHVKVAPLRKKYLVHRLVALAFLPGHFDGASIDHVDGVKTNNRLDNLQWVSLGENTRRQWQSGLVNIRGERHPSAKLTDEQTRAVPILLASGLSQRAVARMFRVSDTLIYKINRGRKPMPT